MASGCKSFSSSGIDEMEPAADSLKYRKVVGIGLTTAGQMFAQRLRAGKRIAQLLPVFSGGPAVSNRFSSYRVGYGLQRGGHGVVPTV